MGMVWGKNWIERLLLEKTCVVECCAVKAHGISTRISATCAAALALRSETHFAA